VRAPLFKETSLRAGFLLSGVWTLHRTPFDYSPQAAHPFGANAKARRSTPSALVRVRAPLFRRTSLWRVFAFLRINPFAPFPKLKIALPQYSSTMKRNRPDSGVCRPFHESFIQVESIQVAIEQTLIG
ncbi:hypothetical protein MUU46_02190, partial [Scandinavium sp. TWS1a]|uniref:hypothetical protein n=1 Tax=Scandinavium tedordense TaxID=2926521 RepID=UPI002165255E